MCNDCHDFVQNVIRKCWGGAMAPDPDPLFRVKGSVHQNLKDYKSHLTMQKIRANMSKFRLNCV